MVKPKKDNIAKILKVKELRDKKKLSFRDIGTLMGRHYSQVHRWYKYDKRKLSTV